MSKKAISLPRVAPLQRVIAQPITDPAERAALDRAHKRHKRKSAGHEKTDRHAKEPAISAAKKRG
jgi:hypothetical protein